MTTTRSSILHQHASKLRRNVDAAHDAVTHAEDALTIAEDRDARRAARTRTAETALAARLPALNKEH